MAKDKTIRSLKEVLANTYVLYLKTQNYHWNICGPNFASLHRLLEDQYKALAEIVDEVAERIRALGARAPGSFRVFESLATIKEARENCTWQEMLDDLVKSYQILDKILKNTLEDLRSENDEVTAELLIGLQKVGQKSTWMLLATLEKS
jgi:starvation-inducible DNA-binding protein